MSTLLVLLTAHMLASSPAQPQRSAPIFSFEADEFWLNLHHFLYVLGRAETKTADSSREAVRMAPTEVERGIKSLTSEEQKIWADAVTAYANGLSRKDPVVDEAYATLIRTLATAGDATTLPPAKVDADARFILERAAPIYRKTWWLAHRSGNRAFQASLEVLIERHGRSVLDFIARKYGMAWPDVGYPVHLAAYANFGGAYSTYGNLLVVATNANSGTQGLLGLESVFHEGMHQWDDDIERELQKHAPPGKGIPRLLSHAMIFFTAGEAIRRVAPEHVPYAESFNLWRGGIGPFRSALEEIWRPYLDGRGTRDDALAALVARTAVSPPAAK
jgi:hypothetical protein